MRYCVFVSAADLATMGNLPLQGKYQSMPFNEVLGGRYSRPIIIAHRGASAHAPEHTLAAYREAILAGADFIEPDLTLTRDGVLVARHENTLASTTNVAELPQFAERRSTKLLDGTPRNDWFTEDFTLAELRTLRACERLPNLRPTNDERYPSERIPTLVEIIALVREFEARGRFVGIYPETKHPTYFAHEGRHLDGSPIHRSLGQCLIDTLQAEGFVDPARLYVQSFEIENLLELKLEIMPAAGVQLPLVQLLGDLGNAPRPQTFAFAHPWDTVYHARKGHDPQARYGDLALALGMRQGMPLAYAALTAPDALTAIAGAYASAVGPWIASVLPREAVSADEDPVAEQLMGAVHPLLARARTLGLHVHAYTLRPELPFRVRTADGVVQSPTEELVQLLGLGVTGVFVDDPALAVEGRLAFERRAEGGAPAP